jgi:hypothetical protein
VAHDDGKPLDLTDELLRALVDGELDASTARRVEAQLAHDERAARFVQRERELRAKLSAVFDPVLDEPVPDRLLAALGKAPPAANDPSSVSPVIDLGAAREALQQRRFGGWPAWAAIAASLLLGVFVGQRLPGSHDAMVAESGGSWVAGASLAKALDTQLAGTQGRDAPVQLATSFVAQDGRYCRSFTLTHEAMAGLACRSGDRWQLEVVAQASTPNDGGFRQAGSALPPAVLQAVDARIAGAPLDAAGEQQALQRHWSPAR